MAAYVHLTSKGALVFRKKVPVSLRGILGKREIKLNLKTRNPVLGLRQAQEMAHQLTEVFSELNRECDMASLFCTPERELGDGFQR